MSSIGAKIVGILLGVALLLPVTGLARHKKNSPAALSSTPQDPPAVIKIEERIAAQESRNVQNLRRFSPRVETYLQEFEASSTMGYAPTSDSYYFGRLTYNGDTETVSFLPGEQAHVVEEMKKQSLLGHLIPFRVMAPYYMDTFASDVMVDSRGIGRDQYDYSFVRTEFLGDIRCLVFDIQARDDAQAGSKAGSG